MKKTAWMLTMLLALAVRPAGAEDLLLGVAAPLTGPVGSMGEQLRQGATRAVADLNAAGGVLGHTVKLTIEDDACDPKQGRSVAEDLSAKKVAAVIGHLCSSTSIPASEVYLENGIVEISPASTNPILTERGLPNVFRVCGRNDQQGGVAADYILRHFAGRAVAIVHDRLAYGTELADQVRDRLRAAGVKVVLDEAIAAGEKDYSALVTRLKENRTQVLYYGGYPAEAGLIARQMSDQGLTVVMIGGDALVTPDFWAITGAAGEGTLMTFSPDPRKLPGNAALVRAFRDHGFEPEAYTLYTYAAVQAWAQAARQAGSTDWQKVAHALKTGTFDTAIGRIGFDAKGDVSAPGYVMYRWSGGRYDEVE